MVIGRGYAVTVALLRRLWQSGFVRRILTARATVPLLVFVVFWAASLAVHGPVYMSDEVGYLDKAATLAGSTVHLSTSWFAGYPVLISPAFFLSANPQVEWSIVLLLNAGMWAASAALLQYVLRRTHPTASRRAVTLATLGAMLYPSWLSMSGYAFATSGFVLVFMLFLAALIKSELKSKCWLGLAGLSVGYLCWIHPLGFLALAAFVALLAGLSLLERRWVVAALAGGSAVFGITYSVLVRPWLNGRMSGSAVNDSHYTDGASAGLLHGAVSLHFWLQVGAVLVGLLFFAVVATFGLAVYAALPVLQRLRTARRSWRTLTREPRFVVQLLPLLLVFGVIAVTALSTATSGQLRIDQWVYGRYTDMYLLPLIGFGLLSQWRPAQAWRLGALVMLAAGVLTLAATPRNTSFTYDNKVNIQGLWPMHLASVVHANWFWVWGLLGAAGVVMAGYMGAGKWKRLLPALVLPVLVAGAGNYVYHLTIAGQHASVSSLYGYVKSHYTANDCIGFTPDPDSNERFNLYSYYLHGYNIKKMTLAQWRQQDCQGPYLTYDAAVADGSSLQVVAVESSTQLLMVAPSGGVISAAATQVPSDQSPALAAYPALIFK